ncbi:MAG TPA: phospholipase D-like domain-containing protein [Caulobacteraceae bacterium]|nr:phospholipase D-like domain-containing protein [Caulobacteraceae bacterium]
MGLLRPGETCWRLEPVRRAKILVDYQDYFAALRTALATARRSIHVLGWGFDPRTRLAPDGSTDRGAPDEVGATLIRLAKERPGVDVRVLVWRSALPISASQAFFPHRAKAWFRGTRVAFRLDSQVPFGACHHQKIVVIDDALAFLGSGDLTGDRWDTPAHLDRDERRQSPWGRPHAPRHEVTVLVEGAVACALGDLFRARWLRATGESLAAPASVRPCPRWPDAAAPDFADGAAAVARTLPAWRERPAVTEISNLALEAIAAAREVIYLENQYCTWPAAAEALAQRLGEPDGPQIVMILSERSPSYFDRLTMDRTRQVILWRLKAADIFGRLHVLSPRTAGGRPIVCHAKVMIVDDRLVRIGSANLNNRSQAFDTEVELAMEARTAVQRAAFEDLRDRMAAHWVGRSGADVARERARRGGLGEALAALDRRGRLQRLAPGPLGPFGEFVALFHLGDPAAASDSWRPWRRRRKLYDQIRAARAGQGVRRRADPVVRSPDENPPPAADDRTPPETVDRAAS